MSTRWEYINVPSASLSYTDERNLPVEDPDAQDVVVISYDECIVLTGTQEQLQAFFKRGLDMVTDEIAEAYGEPRECAQCHDEVQYLSTDGLCDGCVAEQVSAG